MPFPTTLDQVRKTEAKLLRKLPQSYVGRMIEENGGIVEAAEDEWSLHPIFDDSDRVRVKRTCNDIIRETHSAQEWTDFPAGALALAANGSGNLLIFLCHEGSDRFQDAVFVWDHETGHIELVADDFAELTKRSS